MIESFMERVDASGECWLWTGHISAKGYGKFRSRLASTCAYEIYKGPIPPGHQVDHLCRVRKCVNPEHLEAVTPKENTRRGLTGQRTRERQLAKTDCPSGHPYEGNNLYVHKGIRQCKICRRKHFLKHKGSKQYE